ncbi:MAG TPA: hypothetical protein ENK31_08630 [Nannocystis exedens]|nr:hypothetical protein [Nannocystis exedens]
MSAAIVPMSGSEWPAEERAGQGVQESGSEWPAEERAGQGGQESGSEWPAEERVGQGPEWAAEQQPGQGSEVDPHWLSEYVRGPQPGRGLQPSTGGSSPNLGTGSGSQLPAEKQPGQGPPERHPHWLSEYVRDPQRADLVALVSALCRFYGGPRLGDEMGPAEAMLCLRVLPRLGTSAGRELEVELPTDNDELDRTKASPVVLTLALRRLSGLVGPTTPLPLALAERASGPGASAGRLRDFLDQFHHRLFTQLIRGVASFRVPQASDDAELWESRLLASVGLDSPNSQIPRHVRRRLLPLFLGASGPGTPALLDRALGVALLDIAGEQIRVRSQALVRTSASRPQSTLCRLGRGSARLASTGCKAQIGAAPLLLGARLPVRHGLRIRIDHLDSSALCQFSPGAPGERRVRELLSLLAPPGIAWQLELHLRDVAPLRARLGVATLGRTWLAGARSRFSVSVRSGCP